MCFLFKAVLSDFHGQGYAQGHRPPVNQQTESRTRHRRRVSGRTARTTHTRRCSRLGMFVRTVWHRGTIALLTLLNAMLHGELGVVSQSRLQLSEIRSLDASTSSTLQPSTNALRAHVLTYSTTPQHRSSTVQWTSSIIYSPRSNRNRLGTIPSLEVSQSMKMRHLEQACTA